MLLENVSLIGRLNKVRANNIAFTLKRRLCLYKITCYFHFLMLFFNTISIRSFLSFCVFLYIIMCIRNISKIVTKMSINEIK